MYKKRSLKSFLNYSSLNDELFSRHTMTTVIRALLEPVANQNIQSLLFTRFKNKDGINGLIKRLEYCSNVEMIDVSSNNLLIKDDYIELEFLIFTSARYNFALLFDYSKDEKKTHTNAYFIVNSKNVNEVFEILQNNLTINYREKFYTYKPERRENELLNEALFNVFKKLNNNIEENTYKNENDFIIDLSEEENNADKIREISHEIKNQLSILDIYTKIIEKKTGITKELSAVKKALSLIAYELNNLKNQEAHNIKELDLIDIIEEITDIQKEILHENKNTIEFIKSDYEVKIFGNENKLKCVINNIIKNANESTSNDNIQIVQKINNNSILIDIINHGEIITKDQAAYIFNNGFTTKSEGDGIGLFACKKYIKEAGGNLSLLKSDEKETIFRIELPFV